MKKNQIIGIVGFFMFIIFAFLMESNVRFPTQMQGEYVCKNTAEEELINNKEIVNWELPKLDNPANQIIQHVGYTVGYNLNWNIPNWVAYELTDIEVNGEIARSNNFQPDPMVKGEPVCSYEYYQSGYDRGHMAPAADMKWSEQAMEESFYMTNMCPQNHSSNAGDWKELEEFARNLAKKYHRIYICCGPVVTDTLTTIGYDHLIVVPQAFYKVFLRKKENGDWTSIGFVLPNSAINQPLMTYMHTVDEIEKQANIDFFYLLDDNIESLIESDYNISDWTL